MIKQINDAKCSERHLALVITHIDNDNDENDKHGDDEMITQWWQALPNDISDDNDDSDPMTWQSLPYNHGDDDNDEKIKMMIMIQ